MVSDAPGAGDALRAFAAFAKDACLVAHNASFDTGFVFRKGKENGIRFENAVIDTIALCKRIYPSLHSYGLKNIAGHLNIPLEHHRASTRRNARQDIILRIGRWRICCLLIFPSIPATQINETRVIRNPPPILLCKNLKG
jgi:DNA polymerase III alpha subunit (gram-positive type)